MDDKPPERPGLSFQKTQRIPSEIIAELLQPDRDIITINDAGDLDTDATTDRVQKLIKFLETH